MFRKAIAEGMKFTRPVVISRQLVDGECVTNVGSYVVVNDTGHIATAWHIIAMCKDYQAQADAYRKHMADVDRINADTSINPNQKRRELHNLGKLKPKSVKNFSVWWGVDGMDLEWSRGLPTIDLALGKLTNFDPKLVPAYPKFKDPSKPMQSGVSLCKLGYPFAEARSKYDEQKNAFELEPQLVYFPIEGMITRMIDIQHSGDKPPFPERMIETSSPGLMGQSGGPTFDQDGTIWAIQSRTVNLPLGFDPLVPGSKDRHEHQFLNVGWGVSVETIVPAMRDFGISFLLASY